MRNPKHLKDKRSRKPHVNHTKCTQIFATRNSEKVPADNRQALWDFRCTRLKLLSILRRHEKIASILKDVKHRIEPIQFLLSTAEERSLLNANRTMPKSGPNKMQLCGLKCHNSELPTKIRCWLRLHLEELNNMDLLGEQSYAQKLKLSAKKQMQQEHDEHEAWKVFLNDWHNQDDIRQCNTEWQEKGADHADHLEDAEPDDWKKLLSGLNNLDINPKFDLLAESNAKREAPEDYGLANTTHVARENGDWQNILNDLNDWCDQTEPDEILIDADASLLDSNISI